MHLQYQVAISTVLEIRTLPAGLWGRLCMLCLAGGALILAVNLCRAVARINRVVLAIVVLTGCSSLLFSWVHNRNEPRVLTALLDQVSLLFPAGRNDAPKPAAHPGTLRRSD